MKKEEALDLGVPENKIREFQALYSRDLNMRIKSEEERKVSGVKAAIMSMIPMINNGDSLRKLLMSTNHFYLMENKHTSVKHQEAQE